MLKQLVFKQASLLAWAFLMAVVAFHIAPAHADEKGTFMVQEGAFPWFDRVNNWSLTDVPDALKGTGSLPQQSCSSRGLEIPGNPKAVTLGVAKTDVEKFKQKFPAATETGEAIAVKNAGGTKIPYAIVTLPSPPAKIEGAGEFNAGLLLLKTDGALATPAPPAAPATPATPPPAPAAPQNAGEKTFIVQDGAFPWHDRATAPNTWALDGVPSTLKGSGPLPQQSCSSRTLSTPGGAKSIAVGVQENDVAKFKTLYPAATETGDALAVKNPSGTRLPYRIFNLPNPPEKIGEGAGFGAGLLLLKIGDAPAAVTITTSSGTIPKSTVSTGAAVAAPVVAVVSASIAPSGVALPSKENLHIYLLMGQSNMVGRDTSTLASQVDNPRVLALSSDGQWVVAREPMHAGGSGVGPGIPFALEMLKANPKITIGLVPCAVGGTPLSRWVKGADLYERAVSRAKTAAQSGVIKGVLWHQGESDTGNKENAESYETRLTQMFKDLRADLGLANLPIVIGQLGDFLTPEKYPYVETVRGALEHIPVVATNVAYVDATGLGDKGDKLHFSAEAQKEFGIRYANAMTHLQKPRPVVKPVAKAKVQKPKSQKSK